MIFTSGDKLHRSVTPFFLRDDQQFQWAPNSKADLSRLDAHYAALPDYVKAQGVEGFAHCPPPDGDYLTTQLWDRFLPRWREPGRPASEKMKAKVQTLTKAISDSRKFPEENGATSVFYAGIAGNFGSRCAAALRSGAQGQMANTSVSGHQASIQCLSRLRAGFLKL